MSFSEISHVNLEKNRNLEKKVDSQKNTRTDNSSLKSQYMTKDVQDEAIDFLKKRIEQFEKRSQVSPHMAFTFSKEQKLCDKAIRDIETLSQGEGFSSNEVNKHMEEALLDAVGKKKQELGHWKKKFDDYAKKTDLVLQSYQLGVEEGQKRNLSPDDMKKYNKFAKTVNAAIDEGFALNAKVPEYHDFFLPEEASRVKELELPEKKLERLSSKASGKSWFASLKSQLMDGKKLLWGTMAMSTAFSGVGAASVKLNGKDCSLDSRLEIISTGLDHSVSEDTTKFIKKVGENFPGFPGFTGVPSNTDIAQITQRLEKQFPIFKEIVEEYAANPCDEAFKKIKVFIDSACPGIAMWFDEARPVFSDQKILCVHPEKYKDQTQLFSLERIFAHELVHAAQDYPDRILQEYTPLSEGMAEAVSDKYRLPRDMPLADRRARPYPGESHTVGYQKLGRYLLLLEKQRPGTLKRLNRRMQRDRPDKKFIPNDAFLTVTGKTLDNGWKKYVEEENPMRKSHDEL